MKINENPIKINENPIKINENKENPKKNTAASFWPAAIHWYLIAFRFDVSHPGVSHCAWTLACVRRGPMTM